MSIGKFPLHRGRHLLKGVSYGTFRPGCDGRQFPSADVVANDFAMMARAGINTVRLYTAPPIFLLDEAVRHGLHVMVGLPWMQDVAFLDDRSLCRQIRRDVDREVRRIAGHEAVLLFAVGNEVPASIVRWHGRERIERFIGELYQVAKSAAPDRYVTYVNYPPTDYLELPFLDVVAFNVYLHRERALRDYVARLHHIAGNRPLLLAEAGADAYRNGAEAQAALTAMQLRVAFEEGAWGAIAFTWTDEWWRGGHDVEDWSFGLVDRGRRPKPVLHAVSRVFEDAPFPEHQRRSWPKVSVVVCSHNAEDSLDECLTAIDELAYPDFEVIVVDDGSVDATSTIAARHARVTVIQVPHCGLSAARNEGAVRATGEIVAYVDSDAQPHPRWLCYLVQPFLASEVKAVGGPNVVPPDDPWFAQCVARAPGSPQHVLLDDRIAEHVPGCNMAFRRSALVALGGFNPTFDKAGDDIDLCWRLQSLGWQIGFAPSALVWHRHRTSLRAYWRQQVGYGEGEAWLKPLHPEKFLGGRPIWRGHIYSGLPFVRALRRARVNTGVWGSAAFPSVYRFDGSALAYLPHSGRWQAASIGALALSVGLLFTSLRGDAFAIGAIAAAALALTIAKCVGHAVNTDLNVFPDVRLPPRALRRLRYRAVLAALHFVQPLARAYGRARGSFVQSKTAVGAVRPSDATAPRLGVRPSLEDAIRSLRLLTGLSVHDTFWSEQRILVEHVLARLTTCLRLSNCVDMIEVDDGWQSDRDLRMIIGPWMYLDLRAVMEDHGGGRRLLRIATRARLAHLGRYVAGSMVTGGALAVAVALIGLPSVAIGIVALLAAAAWSAARSLLNAVPAIREAITSMTVEMNMTELTRTDRGERVRAGDGARMPSVAPPLEPPLVQMHARREAPDGRLAMVDESAVESESEDEVRV